MKKQGLSLLILLLAAVLVGTYGHFSTHDRVTAVLDDNTIELAKGRRVHLLGVEPLVNPVGITPASGASHTPEEGMGGEEMTDMVSPFLAEIEAVALGQKVVLEFPEDYSGDMATPDLFAYVRLEDGTDLGGWIIEQGFALADTEHSYKRQEEYTSMAMNAQQEERGLWIPVETVAEDAPDMTPGME